MADIEVIIKIPENTYRRIQALASDDYFEHDICGYSMQRIANGTPLPKGHGKIIDEKQITKCEQSGLIMKDGNTIRCFTTDAPTIVGVDKVGE